MKHLWLAGAALLILSVPSRAADLAVYGPPPVVALWSGCYGGANLGGIQADSNFNWTPSLDGCPISGSALQEYGPVTLHATGFTGGAQVGCNYQSGGFAWGGEADFGYTGISATRSWSRNLRAFVQCGRERQVRFSRDHKRSTWNRQRPWGHLVLICHRRGRIRQCPIQ
jgi:opacity protein-like surface antigen